MKTTSAIDLHPDCPREESFDAMREGGIVSGTSMNLRSPRRTTRWHLELFACGVALGCLTAWPVAQAGAQGHKTGHHPPKRMEREQVEDLERQWSKAMLTGDVSAMDRLLSDDYLGVTSSGDLLTKAQQLERMRSRQITMVKLDTSESKIKLLGRIAIVTSLARIDGVSEGKPLAGAFRYTKVYQRLPSGTWTITSFEATHVRPGEKVGGQRAAVGPGQS